MNASAHVAEQMAPAARAGASAEMLRMLTGCWITQALHVAAKLRLADLMKDGPVHASALAAATGADPDALYRVLRALASVNVFREGSPREFELTPLADCLRTDADGSLHAYAEMLGEPWHWSAWEGALYSVQTGRPAFDRAFGMPLFDYLAAHPAASEVFNRAMTSRSAGENAAILDAYDFSDASTIHDIGGGEGALVKAILGRHPAASGVVVDLPHVTARAAPTQGDGIASRCRFIDGDFFADLPAGADTLLLKRVIHDWDDSHAIRILGNCRRSMSRDCRLLVIEPVVAPGNAPSFSKLLDLLMLVWHAGGRERTASEHEALLRAAGLRLCRIVPTDAGVGIIEACVAE